jgi:hypothetical protein
MESALFYRHCASSCDLKTEWAALYRSQRQDVLAPGTCISFRTTSKRLVEQRYVGIIHAVIGTSLPEATAEEHPLLQPTVAPCSGSVASSSPALSASATHLLRPSLASLASGMKNIIFLATQRASAANAEFRGATTVELCVPLLGAGRFRTHWSCDLRKLLRQLISAAADGLLQLNCDLRVTFVLKEPGTAAIGRSCFEEVLRGTASLVPHRDRLVKMIRFLHGDILDMPSPDDDSAKRILVHPCDSELLCQGSFSRQLAAVLAPDQPKHIATLQLMCHTYWQRKAADAASFAEATAPPRPAPPTPTPTDAEAGAHIAGKRQLDQASDDASGQSSTSDGGTSDAAASPEPPWKRQRSRRDEAEDTCDLQCQKNETTQPMPEE